mmetsp:Transcript_35993/g.58233  ORF Transcript_35993/g.58233 Transcript_35993/m.58233 type:complete len:171 (-) Transcript_35993:287-799(-)
MAMWTFESILCVGSSMASLEGSTFDAVRKRFGQHKSQFEQWKKGKCACTTSFKSFDEDHDDAKWGIPEEVEVSCKKDSEKMERKCIENHKCVNKLMPARSEKEHCKQNKEAILQKKKEHHEQNKEKMKEKCQRCTEKTTCLHCDSVATKHSSKRHQRSKKCPKAQNEKLT